MQKQKFFFLFFVLIILQNLIFISATEIQLNKEMYNAGETIFATIKIDFLNEITTDDISFYRGHVLIPVIYDMAKTQDTIYLYAIAPEPETEKNYTITIKNILVRENNTIKEMEISKDFVVLPVRAEFSVNPGFIVTNKDFKIRAENKQNSQENITASFQNTKQQISLPPFESGIIKFSAQDISSFTIINLAVSGKNLSYSIPVLIYPVQVTQNISNASNASISNVSAQEKILNIRFSPASLNITLIKNEKIVLKISLVNLETESVSNISISYDKELEGIISIKPDFISSIEPASSEKLNLTLQAKKEGFFSGRIKASTKNSSTTLLLQINSTENTTYVPPTVREEKKCSELNGTLCKLGETCIKGEPTYATDGSCCINAACETTKQQKSSKGKIIGIIILIVVIIAVFLLFKKFKKAKKKEIKDVFQKSEQDYMKQFKQK